MSVDPSAIVVAVTTATGALIQGADIPAQTRESAMAALEVAEQSAPVIDQKVDFFINQLPAPLQDSAQESVDNATQSMADAVDPYLPREPERPDAQLASPPPELPNIPEQAGGTSVPDRDTTYDSEEVQEFAGGVLLPPIPAVLPAVSLAPVGSVAVFVPWLMKSGQICDGVRPPILAALNAAENGFRYGPSSPVSPSGARGPGQFDLPIEGRESWGRK